jgi:hypothetical protein
METNEYILQEQRELKTLKDRLESLNKKWFKFGFESEIKFLNFLISKKENLINEMLNFKNGLTEFKE